MSVKPNSSKEIIRYALVGVITNGIAYLVFLALTNFGIGPKSAMTVVYAISVIIGYIGHKNLTFDHQGSLVSTSFRYILAHCCGYLLNFGILFLFADHLMYHYQLVQAAAILCVAIFLFVAFKIFVFAPVKFAKTSQP